MRVRVRVRARVRVRMRVRVRVRVWEEEQWKQTTKGTYEGDKSQGVANE